MNFLIQIIKLFGMVRIEFLGSWCKSVVDTAPWKHKNERF